MDLKDFQTAKSYCQNVHSHYSSPRPLPKRARSMHRDEEIYQQWRKVSRREQDVQKMILTEKKVAAYQEIYQQQQSEAFVNLKPDQQFYANQISHIPLRQKYADLIPQYQSAQYSLDHRILIRIQNKLDDHLVYLKLHRGKKKGQFFKSIRKNLLESFHLIMELSHLKQILFIDSEIYSISREKDKDDSYDIFIDLPKQIDINQRKISFKSKLYQYLKANNGLKKSKSISIPLFVLPFEERILKQNREYNIKKCEYEILQQEKKEEKFTLLNVFNKGFEFEKKLKEKIQAKSKKVKEQEILYQAKRFGKEQMLKVIDEVHLIYSSKRVCNIFWGSLIELLSKKLLMGDSIVEQILKWILQDENEMYLRRVQHMKGLIIQVQSKLYSTMRKKIIQMDIN